MIGRIVTRDRKLCVLYETANYSEPTLTRLWWVIERTTCNPYTAERPKEGDQAESQGSGDWRTIDALSRRSTGSVYFSGQKQADYRETINVPKPKVRAGLETRWHNGVWEKCLKAQGWVRA